MIHHPPLSHGSEPMRTRKIGAPHRRTTERPLSITRWCSILGVTKLQARYALDMRPELAHLRGKTALLGHEAREMAAIARTIRV